MFRPGKSYSDPFNDITDKVGLRFVVLLTSEIRIVTDLLESIPGWDVRKDRDYEEEKLSNPTPFLYQSVHYVVWPKSDLTIGGLTVPAGTTCEIQVRTLLQHAYSELSHDAVYKPKTLVNPQIHREMARSMALIETADNCFQDVAVSMMDKEFQMQGALSILANSYRISISPNPGSSKLNLVLLDEFQDLLPADLQGEIERLVQAKPYIPGKISGRCANPGLFSEPISIFVYWLVSRYESAIVERWPVDSEDLRAVFSDLAIRYYPD